MSCWASAKARATLSTHRRGTWRIVEERKLAEQLAGDVTEANTPVVHHKLQLARFQHKHVAVGVALQTQTGNTYHEPTVQHARHLRPAPHLRDDGIVCFVVAVPHPCQHRLSLLLGQGLKQVVIHGLADCGKGRRR